MIEAVARSRCTCPMKTTVGRIMNHDPEWDKFSGARGFSLVFDDRQVGSTRNSDKFHSEQ